MLIIIIVELLSVISLSDRIGKGSNLDGERKGEGLIQEDAPSSSLHGSAVTNLTSIREDLDLIPGLDQWVKDPALQWAVMWIIDPARI